MRLPAPNLIERALAVVRPLGGDFRLEIQRGYPAGWNDPTVAGWLASVSADLLGGEAVKPESLSMGAEDFAYMLQAKPGAYVFIANGQGDHRAIGHGAGPCMLHNPSYDFNDELIPLGVSYWVKLTEKWLAA